MHLISISSTRTSSVGCALLVFCVLVLLSNRTKLRVVWGSIVNGPVVNEHSAGSNRRASCLVEGCWRFSPTAAGPLTLEDSYLHTPNLDKTCSEFLPHASWMDWKWDPVGGVMDVTDSEKQKTGNMMVFQNFMHETHEGEAVDKAYCTPRGGMENSDCENESLALFDTSRAERCLSGRKIHFVGDSISRQQFFSLQAMLYSTSSDSSNELVGNDGSIVQRDQDDSTRWYHRPFKEAVHEISLSFLNGGELNLNWLHRNWWVDVDTSDSVFLLNPSSSKQLLGALRRMDGFDSSTVTVMNMGHW